MFNPKSKSVSNYAEGDVFECDFYFKADVSSEVSSTENLLMGALASED